MRLRASITIDIDASDYMEAAVHQHRLQALFETVTAAFPAAELQIRERRVRAAKRPTVEGSEGVTQIRHYTGKLNRYA